MKAINKKRYVDCSNLFNITVPAARAAVIHSLSQDYYFSQEEISKVLGITQPAVSKCLKRSHSAEIRKLQKFILENKIEKDAVKSALLKKKKMTKHNIDIIAAERRVIDVATKL